MAWSLVGNIKGPSGGAASRDDAVYTTGSLAHGAEETGTITMGKGYRLLAISLDGPARVRLYTTAAKLTADASRPVGADPQGDHGLMFEFVGTEALLSADLSPVVDGDCASASVPIAVQNLSGATDTITVTLTYVATES